MKSHHRWIALTVAVTGILTCLVVLVGFFLTIAHNELPWAPDQTAREHYTAVGQAYSHGFIVGFFLSFSLVIVAVALSSRIGRRRVADAQARPGRPVPPVLAGRD